MTPPSFPPSTTRSTNATPPQQGSSPALGATSRSASSPPGSRATRHPSSPTATPSTKSSSPPGSAVKPTALTSTPTSPPSASDDSTNEGEHAQRGAGPTIPRP